MHADEGDGVLLTRSNTKSVIFLVLFLGWFVLLGCLFAASPRQQTLSLIGPSASRRASLMSMGTGLPVFTGLQVDEKPDHSDSRGTSRGSNSGQNNLRFIENDQAKADWKAAGKRGNFLGTVAAPKVSISRNNKTTTPGPHKHHTSIQRTYTLLEQKTRTNVPVRPLAVCFVCVCEHVCVDVHAKVMAYTSTHIQCTYAFCTQRHAYI